jgi:hypothetical protein
MVMAVGYGPVSRLLTSNDINNITIANSTLISSGIDINGGYYVTFQPNNYGCGVTPNSSLQVELKDNSLWTKITYEMYFTLTSSCWNFNNYGTFGTGNLLTFNSTIDRVFNCVNSFEVIDGGTGLPKYTKQMNACDGATTNFLLSGNQTGTYRSFFVTRRRDTSTSALVKLICELSCNATGAGNNVTFRNIRVW